MLTKLIKYDIRATWRDFTAIFLAIILGVTLIPAILRNVNNVLVNMTIGFVITGIIIAVIVVTIINLFRIYNTNVFSREGYLTMTLPVTPSKVVCSKLIVSTMWIILTGIVSLIGMFIFAVLLADVPVFLNPVELGKDIHQLFTQLGGQGTLLILLLILCCIFSLVKEIAKLFLACSIAHLKQLHWFRIPAGILSYFVISWLETLIVRLLVSLAGWLSSAVADTLHINLFNANLHIDMTQSLSLLNGCLAITAFYTLAISVVFACGIVWLLKHKLDLD